MTTQDNALSQALAQANSIAAMVAALNVDYDRLEELRTEYESLSFDVNTADTEGECKEAQVVLSAWESENEEEYKQLRADANGNTDEDEAREAIQNDALDVQVREDWKNPGEESTPSEFQILLCTGGPAVRIMGELDEHMQPCRAWIEYQDWGTPWTHAVGVIEQDVLLQYCQQFYFGE